MDIINPYGNLVELSKVAPKHKFFLNINGTPIGIAIHSKNVYGVFQIIDNPTLEQDKEGNFRTQVHCSPIDDKEALQYASLILESLLRKLFPEE